MASLTSDQLADMQGDLGISADETVFTDAELNRLFDRAGGSYNLAVSLGVRQLLISAAKFNDYTLGQTQERKSQVFANLKDLYEVWRAAADEGQQIKIVGTRAVPPRRKARPWTGQSGVSRFERNHPSDYEDSTDTEGPVYG
jgi:hypothetical protein